MLTLSVLQHFDAVRLAGRDRITVERQIQGHQLTSMQQHRPQRSKTQSAIHTGRSITGKVHRSAHCVPQPSRPTYEALSESPGLYITRCGQPDRPAGASKARSVSTVPVSVAVSVAPNKERYGALLP
jgi:hypothetical protein